MTKATKTVKAAEPAAPSSSAAPGDAAGSGAGPRAGGDDAAGDGDRQAPPATLGDSGSAGGGDGDMLAAVGTDGGKWASAFMGLFGARLLEIDEGLMIGWFANAIEAGRAAGGSDGGAEEAAAAEIGDVIIHMINNGHPYEGGRPFGEQVIHLIDGLIGEKVEMAEIIKTLRAEVVEQTTALNAAAASLTKAKAAVKERTVRAPKARKAGPVDAPFTRDELRALVSGGDEVEVVFSDGTHELLSLPCIVVPANAWRMTSLGLLLDTPIELAPKGGQPVEVAGFALFVGGEQVAFHRRSDPLRIGAGGKLRLAEDIYF